MVPTPPRSVPSTPVQAPVSAPLPFGPAAPPEKDEVRAALLVPLSGPQAGLGQALSNAAQLALFEVADQRLNLIPLDTKGTAEGAAAAARLAMAQGADIILGPLFSQEVRAVTPVAHEHAVPVVAFTTDRAVVGNGVYTLGFLPYSQVNRVIGYARTQGKERFALLAPSTDYGRAVVEAFQRSVPAQGGQVVKVEYYDAQSTDFSAVAKRFTEMDARSRTRDRTGTMPPPSFDAVMIPDDGVRLRSMSSLITYFEVDPQQVRILGTLLWEDPRLAREPSLQGGWYPAAPLATHQDFDTRYAKAFGANAPRLASMAYDATALAAVLARQNGGAYTPEALTNPNGFAGVDGLFRLNGDGTSDRGLAVREISSSGTQEVSPAPTSFAVPGM